MGTFEIDRCALDNDLIQLLMPKDNGKRRERPEEDIALLEQIQDANPAAAAQYLEYLVLQRRSTVGNKLTTTECHLCLPAFAV